jgi:hypothetical protein
MRFAADQRAAGILPAEQNLRLSAIGAKSLYDKTKKMFQLRPERHRKV